MASELDSNDLETLKALATWMRSVGAVKASTGLIELELGPPPVLQRIPDPQELPEERSDREEADYLKVLLYSSGASSLPFMQKRKA